MKKVIFAVFCMFAIATLAFAGNVAAYNTAFTHMDYSCSTTTEPTIDGQYVAGDEWSASKSETFGTNGVWRDEWTTFASAAKEFLLIETSDATDNAGDYWELCFDGSPSETAETAPKTDDYKVVITGHGATATVEWYKGTGTAWATTTAPVTASFTYAESLSTSPIISTAHYILEIAIDKGSADLPLGMYWAFRVAYNDAATGGNGLQAWPPAPASGDDPSGWGYIDFSQDVNPEPDVAPESLTIGLVLALSAVAVIGGTVLLRKKPLSKMSKQVAV